jgi:hypothetical protein
MELSLGDLYCQYKCDACQDSGVSPAPSSLFFGYSSQPESSAEAIQNAISMFRAEDDLKVQIIDWKDLPIEGNLIFCEICRAIRKSNCAVLNVTYSNFNVLFEYGFALGCGRSVWPLVEGGVEKSDRVYSEFKTLTTIGYSTFANSREIVRKLRSKQAWARVSHIEVPRALGADPTREATGTLYLKSIHNNEPSLVITEILSSPDLAVITDDPTEMAYQPLSWYLSRIGESYAVVVNLGSKRTANYQKHWAKCALVAGLSLALGRRLLIVGEDIELGPIDYRDLIKSYRNARQAGRLVREFLSTIQADIAPWRERKKFDITKPTRVDKSILDRIQLGDYIAENEESELESYFIPTAEYSGALEPLFKVFVGRKGSGKTANFYMVLSKLKKDKRNLVCQIKPREYELNELLQFVKNELDIAKKGYLLESLWKFMLYSEAIKTINENIIAKPAQAGSSPAERAILDYVQDKEKLLAQSFTSRLIQTVRNLVQSGAGQGEIPVSELLHRREINRMHRVVCDYATSHVYRFAMAIDNLDANWHLDKDYERMAEILSALIAAARDMWRDCKRDVQGARHEVALSVLIFLRSDIFRVVLEREREPDKLQHDVISWRNAETVLKVVERRIAFSIENGVTNWIELLEPSFSPREMVELLARNIIFRPRDIIYYFQRIMYYARLRNAKLLNRDDFKQAMTDYSDYALLALSAESQPYIPDMLDLLLAFSEGKSVCSSEELDKVFSQCGIGGSTNLLKTRDFLLDANFLGYGIDNMNYVFPTSPPEADIAKRKAFGFASKNNTPQRFKIHRAFHESLGIQK